MPEPFWIDIGVNLTDSSFDKDRDKVIEDAFESEVKQLIVTGTTLEESLQAIELCQLFEKKLYCTAGVHPHYAKDHSNTDLNSLLSLYSEACVVAVGETGLDFNRNFSSPSQQIETFEKHLEFAAETQLPLFLHERDAHKQQLEILRSHRDDFTRGVAHCFTGSRKELYNYLDLDLYIGVTGWICDERRGAELQQLVKDIPHNRLMIETDAPYLIPRDIKPKPKSRRNLPKYLPHVAERIAILRETSPEQLKAQLQKNSQTFFKI